MIVATDGEAAWSYLDALPRPSLLILGENSLREGPEDLCARIARRPDAKGIQIVLWANGQTAARTSPHVRAVLPRTFELRELEEVVTGWRKEVAG